MPTLFIGHGSPLNAIEDNEFALGWKEIASSIPRPVAILCISAHWFVPSTMLTAMEHPRTIHDFYGFPPKLYEQQYPAPGSSKLVAAITKSIKDYTIGLDHSWGLDHGTWSVLKRMYPEANIPTIQLSINYSKPVKFHFELGKKLRFLRSEGVLIIGSGNLVHNLAAVNWHNPDSSHDWAIEFEKKIVDSLYVNNADTLFNLEEFGNLAKKAHPSLDHYLPLLYARGAAGESGSFETYNEKIIYGSISMTSFKFD